MIGNVIGRGPDGRFHRIGPCCNMIDLRHLRTEPESEWQVVDRLA
jgi:hypothetical protein